MSLRIAYDSNLFSIDSRDSIVADLYDYHARYHRYVRESDRRDSRRGGVVSGLEEVGGESLPRYGAICASFWSKLTPPSASCWLSHSLSFSYRFSRRGSLQDGRFLY